MLSLQIFEEEAKKRQVEAGEKRAEAKRNSSGEFVQLNQKIDEAGKPKKNTQATQQAAETRFFSRS